MRRLLQRLGGMFTGRRGVRSDDIGIKTSAQVQKFNRTRSLSDKGAGNVLLVGSIGEIFGEKGQVGPKSRKSRGGITGRGSVDIMTDGHPEMARGDPGVNPREEESNPFRRGYKRPGT